jgi:N-acetyltransferase
MADMEVKPVVLTGKHVRLEPMSEEHVPGLAEIGVGQTFWDFMLYGNINTVDDMRNWVLDILVREKKGTDLPFAVIHLASGRVAGATRYLNIEPQHRGLEIGGTWYGTEFQRTVVNTECKYLLLRHAFETLGCIRVQLKTDLRNEPSQRAIERIGAVKEGVLRNHMILPDGRIRHSVFYSVIDTEWPEVKKRLEEMLVR